MLERARGPSQKLLGSNRLGPYNYVRSARLHMPGVIIMLAKFSGSHAEFIFKGS